MLVASGLPLWKSGRQPITWQTDQALSGTASAIGPNSSYIPSTSSEVEACSYARLHKSVSEAAGDFVRGLPAGAVAWDEDIWANTCQLIQRGRDNGVEE